MMIVLVGATGVLVAAIAALALQSWWVLIALLLLHAVVTTSVVVYTLGRAGDTYDKPDPVTEARIEEERDERRRPGDRDREVFS